LLKGSLEELGLSEEDALKVASYALVEFEPPPKHATGPKHYRSPFAKLVEENASMMGISPLKYANLIFEEGLSSNDLKLVARLADGGQAVPVVVPKVKKKKKVEKEEVKEEVEEEKGRRLSKTAAIGLIGLAVGAPIVTYLGYRYYLKTRPPVITSIGYAQSAPISGDVYKYQDLRFRKPVVLVFYVNAEDPKGINRGISSVTIELFGSNRTMERSMNGTYSYTLELENLTGNALRGLTLLRDTVAIPFKVYARDADGNVACNESMMPLEFKEVMIEDFSSFRGEYNCEAATLTFILNYWDINATEKEVNEILEKEDRIAIARRYRVVYTGNYVAEECHLEVEPKVMIIMGIPVLVSTVLPSGVPHGMATIGFKNQNGSIRYFIVDPLERSDKNHSRYYWEIPEYLKSLPSRKNLVMWRTFIPPEYLPKKGSKG